MLSKLPSMLLFSMLHNLYVQVFVLIIMLGYSHISVQSVLELGIQCVLFSVAGMLNWIAVGMLLGSLFIIQWKKNLQYHHSS